MGGDIRRSNVCRSFSVCISNQHCLKPRRNSEAFLQWKRVSVSEERKAARRRLKGAHSRQARETRRFQSPKKSRGQPTHTSAASPNETCHTSAARLTHCHRLRGKLRLVSSIAFLRARFRPPHCDTFPSLSQEIYDVSHILMCI
mmetsp:Transcript_10198/g.37915  ORF Transcript_10198/g.37915 Transcript_10198/m.37915 type:complete len:144 (+) Transcript_10198:477-908(+)